MTTVAQGVYSAESKQRAMAALGWKQPIAGSGSHYNLERGARIDRSRNAPTQQEEAPMRCNVETRGNDVCVQIDGVSGHEEALLEGIRRCRQSAWACQSGECVNIGTMEERVEGGSMFLTLTPRPGAQLDPGGIETCLRYLLASQASA